MCALIRADFRIPVWNSLVHYGDCNCDKWIYGPRCMCPSLLWGSWLAAMENTSTTSRTRAEWGCSFRTASVLCWVVSVGHETSLIPRPFPHLQYLIACSMQIQRRKAWEIWSHVVTLGKQMVDTWGAVPNSNNSHSCPWWCERRMILMLPC